MNDTPGPPPARTGSDAAAKDGAAANVDLPRISTAAVLAFAAVFLLLLGALFLAGWLPRWHKDKALRDEVAERTGAAPLVKVTKPEREAALSDLLLPGDTAAVQETAVFPRASGYLKELLVDIGDRVTKGQLLARIDTPEVDAELSQAKATLAQTKAAHAQAQASVAKAHADLQLTQSTLDRYAAYGKTGGVTQQQLEEKQTAVEQAKAAADVVQAAAGAADAAVAAAQASVERITDLQSFEKVEAPFDGTVTARNYDVGALLSPATTGAGREMFRITQDNPLRVFVNVPQAFVTLVKPGQAATLTVSNYPGRKFSGQVVRSTAEIDPSTRTLRFEVHVNNADHALYAGMYGQIHFQLHSDHPLLTVPSSALIFAADGLKVAVVHQNQAHFQHVAVGRDLGTRVEVSEGLSSDDDVVVNPGQRLTEGSAVQVAPSAVAAAPAAQPADLRTAHAAKEATR